MYLSLRSWLKSQSQIFSFFCFISLWTDRQKHTTFRAQPPVLQLFLGFVRILFCIQQNVPRHLIIFRMKLLICNSCEEGHIFPWSTLSHTLWAENLTSVEAYECADTVKVSRRFSFLDEKRREGGGMNLQSCIPPRLRVQKLRHRTSFPSDVDLHSTKNSCNPNRDVQKAKQNKWDLITVRDMYRFLQHQNT